MKLWIVFSISDVNQNIFKDADEKKVEKPKTCSTQPPKPKNYGDTEIDSAVRELILADAVSIQLQIFLKHYKKIKYSTVTS